MTGTGPITFKEYANFTAPLRPEEFITFDIVPNSSMVALEKSDFENNERWAEFVSRYVRTAEYTRSTFYLDRMSPSLKEDLIWAIALLWRGADDGADKNLFKSVLKQDFRIDPGNIQKREDVNREIDNSKWSAGLGASYYQDADKIRHSRYLLYSMPFSGTASVPFRIGETARIAPTLAVDAALITGNRKLEGQDQEELDYFAGLFTLGLDARDMSDLWNVGGQAALLRRIDGPSGFSYFDVTWNAYANANHILELPVDIMLTLSGLSQAFLPPAEEEHYKRDTNQYVIDAPVAVVFSNRWSLIGVYNYLFNHQILYFSMEDRYQHTGALKLRSRSEDGYVDAGLRFSSEKRDRRRKTNGTEIDDQVERLKAGLGGEYFVSLGGGKSLQLILGLLAVDSSGDLDATFLECSTNGTFFLSLFDDMELNFMGSLVYNPIYQKDREYELTYGLQVGPTWHILKNLSLIGTGIFQQTKSQGGLNDDNITVGGALTVSSAFSLMGQELGADLMGEVGRYLDGENYDETYGQASFMFKMLF